MQLLIEFLMPVKRVHRKEQDRERDRSRDHVVIVESYHRDNPTPLEGAFHTALSHLWFQRMWIVQEAVLARTLVVQLGQVSNLWSDFSLSAARFLANLLLQKSLGLGETHKFHSFLLKKALSYDTRHGLICIDLINRLRSCFDSRGLLPVPPSRLLLCRQQNSSDPRDKVYGLLGLIGETSNDGDAAGESFVPDFRLDPGEVYARFSFYCLKREGNLDLLAPFRGFNTKSTRYNLPMWAVDCSETLDVAYNDSTVDFHPLKSAGKGHSNYHEAEMRHDLDALSLRGYLLDSIRWDPSIYDPSPWNSVYGEWMKEMHITKIPEDFLTLEDYFEYLTYNLMAVEFSFSPLWNGPRKLRGLPLNSSGPISPVTPEEWHSMARFDLHIREITETFGKVLDKKRSLYVTTRGRLAIASRYVSIGDKIWALKGGRSLFVVRDDIQEDGPSDVLGRTYNKVICGGCSMHPFHDGGGVQKAQELELMEAEVYLSHRREATASATGSTLRF